MESRAGDLFTILAIDPDRTHRSGFIASSLDGLTEAEARDHLTQMGVGASDFARLFRNARQQFASQRAMMA